MKHDPREIEALIAPPTVKEPVSWRETAAARVRRVVQAVVTVALLVYFAAGLIGILFQGG